MKTYTLEVSEKELMKALFVMGCSNGEDHGVTVYQHAFDVFLSGIGAELLNEYYTKRSELKEIAIDFGRVDYFSIQQEWEDFLTNLKKKGVEDKIESLKKEIAELEKLL